MTRGNIGDFLRLVLPDGTHAYGRVLDFSYVAFYGLRTVEPMDDVAEIERQDVIFSCSTEPFAGRWTTIGNRPLRGRVAEPVVMFMQDRLHPTRCLIFDSEGGERSATPEECVGLERSVAWSVHRMEERLLDYFLGRPNAQLAHARVVIPR